MNQGLPSSQKYSSYKFEYVYMYMCIYIYTKNKYYTIIFYTYSISYPYKIIQRSIYDHMIYTYLYIYIYIYIHNISIIYFQSISIYKDDLNLFHPQISAAMHPLHGRIPNLESPAPGSAWVDLRNALRCVAQRVAKDPFDSGFNQQK